jgi:Kef-type K+ transport system membrane component KefB
LALDGSPLQVFLVVLLPASLLGLTARRFGFSSIVGYVAAGVLVGPVFNLVEISSPVLDFLRELGIILIAFQIGLTIKLDSFPRWRAGGVVLVELFLVGGLMSLAGVLLNLGFAAAFILALMALNTSSAVVFHLLDEDRQSADEPIVGIALGVGAFEDIISIVGLALLSAVTLSEEVPIAELPRLLFIILVTMMLIFATRIARHVIHHFGLADKELLMILSATFVIAFAFVGELLGLSTALGAFVAGLAVSSIVEAEEIRERFLSFTDVAALVFFASIGASLPALIDVPLVAIVVGISILVILVKYFSFSISSWLVGANRRDAFQIGLYMIAISEFGIIIASEGFKSGVISEQIYLVSIVAMVVSTVIASSLRNRRVAISQKLASLVPEPFASLVENTMSVAG